MSDRDDMDRRPEETNDTGSTGDDQVVDERVQARQPAPTAAPDEQPSPSLAGTIRQTLFKRPGTREQIPATEASKTNLSAVNATTVLMNQSGSEQITAERVTLERSGSRSIDAKSVQMDRSGVVALSSDNAVLLKSSAIQVVAEEARLSHSSAVFLSSEKASLDHSRVVIFSGSADGDVQALITARSAAIFGGAFAATLFLLASLVRLRSRG